MCLDLTSYLLGKKSSKGGGLDWKTLGFSGTPQLILDGYNTALEIKENWSSTYTIPENVVFMPLVDLSAKANPTSMGNMFYERSQLLLLASLDTSNVTSMRSTFAFCYSLQEVPAFNTKNVTDMYQMFNYCYSLQKVPVLDTSKVTTMQNMFKNCENLSNDSLNNILKMCANTTSAYTRTKTLKEIGIAYLLASRCQNLSNYQEFLDAGWTTGY